MIMKTIEEAAMEYGEQTVGDSYVKYQADCGFKAGAKFAQRWISVEEELPICYETGSWDGMRSEFVLARNKSGYWTKARLYSGTMDGSAFGDWVDEYDFIIDGIVEWRPIELK